MREILLTDALWKQTTDDRSLYDLIYAHCFEDQLEDAIMRLVNEDTDQATYVYFLYGNRVSQEEYRKHELIKKLGGIDER